MKKNLPYILIVACSILIILNIIFTEIDTGFYMRNIANVLIILSMILTIRARNKQEK